MIAAEYFVYVVGFFAAIGGFLFGYDTGVISGVLEMDEFTNLFNPGDWEKGFIVAFFQIGCILGSLGANFIADSLGRTITIFTGSIVFCVGATLQCSSFHIAQLYIGRLIAGVAVGSLSMVVPLYQSEVAPKAIRGRLISLQQLAITIGIMVSFWVDYGVQYMTGGWRLALALQIAPALALLGMPFMPQSPRWLVARNRHEAARRSLVRMRRASKVDDELKEIIDSIEAERLANHLGWMDLFKSYMRRRLIIGVLIQCFQQLTGINVIMYYAPTIFTSIASGMSNLFAQGITGIVNFATTVPALFLVDRVGRKTVLLIGSAGMATAFIVLTVLFSLYSTPSPTDASSVIVNDATVGVVMVVMIYLFVANFAYSWGPIGWIIPAEIFPQEHRARAMSLAVASNWLMNVLISVFTPVLLGQIQWRLFIIFIILIATMAAFVLFFVPETKGKSLEELDVFFNKHSDTIANWREEPC